MIAGFGPTSWCLLAAALFGASTPACKWLLGQTGPVALAALLYFGAALVSLPSGFKGARRALDDAVTRRRLVAVVVFGGVLGPVFLLLGLELAPAGSVALLLNLETVATVLLGWLVFREHVGKTLWCAAALVCLGGVLLASPGGFEFAPAAGLIAFACIAWGLDNHYTALIDGLTPGQTTLVKGVVGGAFNTALALALGQSFGGTLAVFSGLIIGVLAYGMSIILYVSAAQQLGATRAQLIFATAPFWGLALAWTLLDEPILLVQGIAALLMLGAIALLNREQHGHIHRHSEMSHIHWHRHDDDHHDHDHDDDDVTHPTFLGWHCHPHRHEAVEHSHPHRPDLHHRHDHHD